MNKGIVVVDIPKTCDQCPIRHPGCARCQITGKSTSHTSAGKLIDQKTRPGWCPIKPMTEERSNHHHCEDCLFFIHRKKGPRGGIRGTCQIRHPSEWRSGRQVSCRFFENDYEGNTDGQE